MLRPARPADRPALIDLALAEDAAWSDAAPVSRDEAGELVDSCDAGVVYERDGRAVGYAAVGNGGAPLLLLPPGTHAGQALEALVAWLEPRSNGEVPAYVRDTPRIAWLEASGRAFVRGVHDLVRPAQPPPPPPAWPDGVAVARFRLGVDDEGVHALVYDDAAWAEVSGHTHRSLQAWLQVIHPDGAWVASRDGRAIGWVCGQVFPDGRGWIEQIAVARADRRIGVGRALLLQVLADLRRHGATSFALGVQGGNDEAIALYRDVGFAVEREWRLYARPRSTLTSSRLPSGSRK
jgi:ribosomal protein S18 acetylase RimI-like enzyme